MSIDLVPFGFTPTESSAYCALLELGPSGGYAVARALGIARANGYQALDGLVAKGAAESIEQRPKRYRALRPPSLLALIGERQAAKMDRLEEQVREAPDDGGSSLVPVEGIRALRDLVTRAVVRGSGPIRLLAPAAFLEALSPAIRARAGASDDLSLWSADRAPDIATPVILADRELISRLFEDPPVLLVSGDGVLAASGDSAPSGYWTSATALAASVQAAFDLITQSP